MANLILNFIFIIFLCIIEIFPQDITEVIGDYERYNIMKILHGGQFLKGMNDPKSDTGEYPVEVSEVKPFYIDVFPVTNAQFWQYMNERNKYRTIPQKKGWSWVPRIFVNEIDKKTLNPNDKSIWVPLRGAQWNRPEGGHSTIRDRLDYPVVHVTYTDAEQFCRYHGKRLPMEEEWEFAARGGLLGQSYPWGDRYQKNRSNLWQGKFPHGNVKVDGWVGLSPVDAFKPQNGFGLFDFLGNVWEWTTTRYYERIIPPEIQDTMYTVKGCSFMDTRDGRANSLVRVSQRTGQDPNYSAYNVGFRCVKSAKHHWKAPVFPQQHKKKKLHKEKRRGPRKHLRSEMADPDLAQKIMKNVKGRRTSAKRKEEL